MNKSKSGWVLIAFFFIGGAAFTYFEETRWIGIGQIWMLVAVVLGIFYLGLGGKLADKFKGTRRG